MAINNKDYISGISNLNKITRATNEKTYGITRDMSSTLTSHVDEYVSQLRQESDKDRSLLNSHIAPAKLGKKKQKDNMNELYDIIGDDKMIESIQSLLGTHNAKFAQTLKDYEIVKRCIPQIHKVVNTIKNNIKSPDAITQTAIGIKIPEGTSEDDKAKILNICEKFKLNEKLEDIIMEYLIVAVKYMTVVPYSDILKMLSPEKENITVAECAALIDEQYGKQVSLLEATGEVDGSEMTPMLESAYEEIKSNIDKLPDNTDAADAFKVLTESADYTEFCDGFNTHMNDIEFIDGGLAYYRNSILNEAIAVAEDKEERSMRSILRKIKKNKNKKINSDITVEGLLSPDNIDDIKKHVDFKGCHIEELDATKTIPFKMRDTVIGYFYVEDKISKSDNKTYSTIMDKINSTVYMSGNMEPRANPVENMLVKTITDKMIKAINPKFLNDNYDDMNIIYEFVRENELCSKSKRVVFFHPDDICEFRRHDGSIMKNGMFMAKLYILTMLSNVITNVARGSDRQMWYVKTGLTTDIEGHVNKAIRAIKQSQIRYSDVGTINEVFNVVGSNVDAFIPESSDGEKPISTEVVAGQDVDMNDSFLQFLVKSIILSFGAPTAIIEDFEQVDFAKTLSMSNLDMARNTLDSQLEIIPVLTKLFRLLVQYELPDYERVDEIEATLNAPTVIVTEMNKERISSVQEMAELLSSLLFAPAEEDPSSKRIRLFKLAYFRRSMPTIDWDAIDDMVNSVMMDEKIESKTDKIGNKDTTQQDGGESY